MARERIEGEEKPPRSISSEELRAHNKPTDLWISIQGKIYDATAWAAVHPGGDLPLLALAGQDITDAFIAYHPGSVWAFLANNPSLRFVGQLSDYRVSDVSKDYRRLVAEFSRLGLFDKKGHGTAISLSAIAVVFAAVIYCVLRSESVWAHLGCAAVMGFLWMQSGFLGHDSGHYEVTGSKRTNRAIQVLSGNCLTGLSIGWWKRNHNVHHVACNSLDIDPDLQHIPVFAVSAEIFRSLTSTYYERKMTFDAVARALVSYQHWTFYPVMCVARVNLFAQTLLLLCSNKRVPGRFLEILGVVVFWIWFPLLVSCLPSWSERVLFVLASFAVAGIQHVQFCLNHFSTNVYVGPPQANDWFQTQTMGTLDIACPPWMDWFHGGLQFQVEHHLFPRLPRAQLRRVAPIVRELCLKHGLPYNSFSFWEANVRTIATLRAAALLARDEALPVPKNLVWEAVNTHG
ncbi:delta(8)-fatty-acid desaturase 2-like [Curcuma longa]|uniref:delta(8)-fatty-acid desaturase 2-like n=1 Tax=Curcuma longa TaxID=136217 RepID=UPI003D9E64E5